MTYNLQDIKKILADGEKERRFLKEQSQKSGVVEIFKKYGKDPNDLEDIFGRLMAAGSNENAAMRVVSDEVFLEKYLHMKSSGISDLEVALELRKEISGY